jgi:type IV pilus assembly protein PilM
MRFRKPRTAVGLDIGSSSVKIVELSAGGDQIHLLRWGSADFIPDAIVDGEIMDRQHVVETIQNLVEERGISNRRVVTSISGRGVIVKRVTMARTPAEEADEAIRWEAEQHVPYEIADVILDYHILGTDLGPKEMQVLLVAAKQDVIAGRVEIVREAGLVPVAVDIDAFAMQNALEWGHELDPDQTVALLDVGAELTNIHVVRGGTPLYSQDLATGTRTLLESIRKTYEVTREEALTALRTGGEEGGMDLTTLLDTFSDDLKVAIDRAGLFLKTSGDSEQVDRIILAGGGSEVSGLIHSLEQKTTVPVEAANPLRRIQVPDGLVGDLEHAGRGLTVSIGLAIREAVAA